jgi:hypothetical protein
VKRQEEVRCPAALGSVVLDSTVDFLALCLIKYFLNEMASCQALQARCRLRVH